MTTFSGADTGALRQLGQAMGSLSAEVERVGAVTTGALEQLAWTGADRTGFHGSWVGQHAPALRSVATALVGARDDVAAQAEDQDRASSGTGGSGTGGTSTAGAAGGTSAAGGTTTAGAAGGTGAAGVGAAAVTAPGAAAPARPADPPLGSLSAREESNGDPGRVSTGRHDPGGVSYGSYQLSTNEGTAAEFVRSLRRTHPDYYSALSAHPPGSAAFSAEWTRLATADRDGFGAIQHEFIRNSHYEPNLARVERALPGIDVAHRAPVVADVLWSTANQHRGYTESIFTRAVGGRDVTTMSDADLIRAVYAERGQAGRFPRLDAHHLANVRGRFAREQRDALARLGGE